MRTARFGFFASVATEFFSFALEQMRPPDFCPRPESLGSYEVYTVGSEDLFQNRHVERLRRLNKAVGSLLRRIEFFLFYLGRRSRICLGRLR